jgi:hypothetical protein
MSCLQVHDFIIGTTIVLPRGKARASARGEFLDIVRPNAAAAALVADHLARIAALRLKRCRTRRAA